MLTSAHSPFQTPDSADFPLHNIREIAQGPLRHQVDDIDRGIYPADLLRRLVATGATSAHLQAGPGPVNYGLTIQAIAEVSQVCGATGFLLWCHAVCGLYLEASGNPALTGEVLERHLSGDSLGGTGLSNPMKSYAGIESLLLKAEPVPGGYRVNGSLPWVSHLGPNQYCGAIAAVAVEGQSADRELMFLLRCNAPGVELRSCPAFSGMEGTGTYGLRLTDVFVGPDDIIADPAKPTILRIRGAFVLMQCGMALGVTQGAINSMRVVEKSLGHVNRFLDDGPDSLQTELNALSEQVLKLAHTPFDPAPTYLIEVLEVRARGSELALKAAQAALLHQGARGYLMSSDVQRRVRESHFVAIVTPAIKHLRKEIHRLRTEAAAS